MFCGASTTLSCPCVYRRWWRKMREGHNDRAALDFRQGRALGETSVVSTANVAISAQFAKSSRRKVKETAANRALSERLAPNKLGALSHFPIETWGGHKNRGNFSDIPSNFCMKTGSSQTRLPYFVISRPSALSVNGRSAEFVAGYVVRSTGSTRPA